MKNIYLTLILSVAFFMAHSQVITIAEARTKSLGTTVTIRGIILNGDEIGTARYIDDGTGGLGIFSVNNTLLKRGDSIEISGSLGHFNNLLQLSSGVTFTKLDSNKKLPQPIEFNNMNAGAFAKAYEGRLVMIKSVTSLSNVSGTSCSGPATVFAGNKNYCINNSSGTPVRVSNPTGSAGDIIGKNAPSGSISIVGIMSMFNKGTFSGGTTSDPQYYDTTLSTGFQLLARLYEDFVLPPKPNFIDDPHPTWNVTTQLPNISTTEVELEFTTQNLGTTRLEYGTTTAFGTVIGDSLYNKKHIVKLTGLTPSTVYYIRATSSNPNGVSISKLSSIVTKSNSSGTIKVYFNHQPDTSVATFSKATFLDKAIDDTVVAYINRAKKTIDLAIYNINPTNLADFIKALNDAHARGVTVRVVYDATTANIGLNNLDPAIGLIGRNTSGTIMHNKFMAIDANDTDPNVPIVWGGSCNLTRGQIETDHNNVVFIQDQSLAKAYTVEFEEMFGSNGSKPDANKSKFGANKTNNTPHDFIINGKYVEQYFSPTDLTTSHIIATYNAANTDEYFMTMSFTRTDISTAIRSRVFAGVYAAGVVNDTSSGAAVNVYNALSPSNVLGNRFLVYSQTGIMHEKVAIVDPNNCSSDPMIITGSHNWSANAENDNDENSIIIHDADIANQYYQAFSGIYKKETGSSLKGFVNFNADNYTPNKLTNVNFFDRTTFKPTTWAWDFGDGQTATTANPSHTYNTAGTYQVKLWASNGNIYDSAIQTVVVKDVIGFSTIQNQSETIAIYPNPANDYIYIQSQNSSNKTINLYDLSGKVIMSKQINKFTETIDLNSISKGIYIIQVLDKNNSVISFNKVIVQ
ncbi:MAG: T9SS type A sorting domain-containing protein [Bacteroidetes bacterium]|nr:T9SS type A sorting domain-containing protein [Bacteroidota bacterium]